MGCDGTVCNEQVARQILPAKEIARIWERSEYDEDEQVWVLPRIKPRASYTSDSCKLPLLAAPNITGDGSSAGVDDDVSGKTSGRKDRRRLGGRSRGASGVGGEIKSSTCEVDDYDSNRGAESSSGGSYIRTPASARVGVRVENGGREERRKTRSSGRYSEDRPLRWGGDEIAPKEENGEKTDPFSSTDTPPYGSNLCTCEVAF